MSSIFFLSELEEMKNCIYRIETAKAVIGVEWFWHLLPKVCLQETVVFTTGRVCERKFMKSLQSISVAPAAFHCAALLQWKKVSLGRVRAISEENGPENTNSSKVIRLIKCRRATLPSLDVLSNRKKFVNCNRRLSVSLYKEFCNVF